MDYRPFGAIVLALIGLVGLPGCYTKSVNLTEATETLQKPRGQALKWWQNGLIYEIFVESFYDSDGDGIGDLNGVTEKVGYLKELGVTAIWLDPIYASPGKDHGYDISDYKAINCRLGTMKDFERLIKTYKEHGIKVILDFVPNHTSDQHPWFKKSLQRQEPYMDFYVWKDYDYWSNGKPAPPSNWESIFNQGKPGSAWKWSEDRSQFYYHAFREEQPDLNLRNPKVIEALKDILRFWLQKGVNGFRIDAVLHLYEDKDLRDETNGDHKYTQNLPETYAFIADIRAFTDSFSKKWGEDIFITTEGYTDPQHTLQYYGTKEKPGAHFPFNFLLLTNVDHNTDAGSLQKTISEYLSKLDTTWQHPNWVSGNHDWPRIPSRMGGQTTVDQVNILTLLLPGCATVFMGDEIGMDSYWNIDRSACPVNNKDDYRTPNRVPFQWDTQENAGFTSNENPWLPINPDYYRTNVLIESETGCGGPSHLKTFKLLAALKSSPTFTKGEFEDFVIDDQVYGFSRESDKEAYLCLFNLGKKLSDPFVITDYAPKFTGEPGNGMSIVAMSVNMKNHCINEKICNWCYYDDGCSMPPKSALVLLLDKTKSDKGSTAVWNQIKSTGNKKDISNSDEDL